jgi:pectate lyase
MNSDHFSKWWGETACKVLWCGGILLLFVLTFTLFAIPAFPGAQGNGARSTGGRGGSVVYVTNLNASGPGSLNHALSMKIKRYILFAVSGVIPGAANIAHGDFYLAGQTSPGGIVVNGLQFDYDAEGVENTNITIRHIRSRRADDPLRIHSGRNVIVEHCSFGNGTDECVQLSCVTNVTLQNCILAETIGAHYDRGGLLITYTKQDYPLDSISIHHNLFYRIWGRLPEFSCTGTDRCGDRFCCDGAVFNTELASNLYWDPGRTIEIKSNGEPMHQGIRTYHHLNWVNNYFKVRDDYRQGMLARGIFAEGNSLYARGNHMNLYPQYRDYQIIYGNNDFYQVHPNKEVWGADTLSKRHELDPIEYTPVQNLREYMITHAGAFPRDSMDRRALAMLKADKLDPQAHNYDYQDALLTSEKKGNDAVVDTDKDGMPDYWETLNKLNVSVQDHNETNLSLRYTGIEGYTNLECYLNALSDSLIFDSSTVQVLPIAIQGYPGRAPTERGSLEQILKSGYHLRVHDISGRIVAQYHEPSDFNAVFKRAGAQGVAICSVIDAEGAIIFSFSTIRLQPR